MTTTTAPIIRVDLHAPRTELIAVYRNLNSVLNMIPEALHGTEVAVEVWSAMVDIEHELNDREYDIEMCY